MNVDSETKRKIDAIWQGMWDNGMADAKTNITQITASNSNAILLFIILFSFSFYLPFL